MFFLLVSMDLESTISQSILTYISLPGIEYTKLPVVHVQLAGAGYQNSAVTVQLSDRYTGRRQDCRPVRGCSPPAGWRWTRTRDQGQLEAKNQSRSRLAGTRISKQGAPWRFFVLTAVDRCVNPSKMRPFCSLFTGPPPDRPFIQPLVAPAM